MRVYYPVLIERATEYLNSTFLNAMMSRYKDSKAVNKGLCAFVYTQTMLLSNKGLKRCLRIIQEVSHKSFLAPNNPCDTSMGPTIGFFTKLTLAAPAMATAVAGYQARCSGWNVGQEGLPVQHRKVRDCLPPRSATSESFSFLCFRGVALEGGVIDHS